MRSQVRFDVIDPPLVGQATDYSALGLDAEVVDGKLIALIVEVEHKDAATIVEISLAARKKLRHLITKIRLTFPISGFDLSSCSFLVYPL